MQNLHDGQCGLCAHFGETHAKRPDAATNSSLAHGGGKRG